VLFPLKEIKQKPYAAEGGRSSGKVKSSGIDRERKKETREEIEEGKRHPIQGKRNRKRSRECCCTWDGEKGKKRDLARLC